MSITNAKTKTNRYDTVTTMEFAYGARVKQSLETSKKNL